MVIGTELGWSAFATIALAIAFGYGQTMLPLLRSGVALAAAVPLALASDTLHRGDGDRGQPDPPRHPGAMDVGLGSPLFWGSLAVALAVAFLAAFPVNRYLIARGRGHAVVHRFHGH